ncbi:MAG: antibiotic biosynthesis monooxygenase family protein [Patulibacter sp.]
MSFTAVLAVQFQPDVVEEGLAALGRVLADTRAFAGCRSVTVVHDIDDPTRVLAIETWDSLEADDAYRMWRAGEGAPTELVPLLAAAPTLTRGEPLTDL